MKVSRYSMIRIPTAAMLAVLSFAAAIAAQIDGGGSTTAGETEKVMADYKKVVDAAESVCSKRMEAATEKCGLERVREIERAGSRAVATLERAAKRAEESGATDQAAVFLKKLTDLKEEIKRDKSAEPYAPPVQAQDDDEEPVVPYVKYGGRYYLAVSAPVTWATAKAMCARMGGHLVYLNNATEVRVLQQQLPCNRGLWVGALNPRGRGKWIWINGKPVSRRFWRRDQPGKSNIKDPWFRANRRKIKQGASNMFGAMDGNGMFSVSEKAVRNGFICEWDR